jgi:hypothetical protein
VLREEQLVGVLARLSDDYEVLEIANRRLHHYQTCTSTRRRMPLLPASHGQGNRYKVRAGLTWIPGWPS